MYHGFYNTQEIVESRHSRANSSDEQKYKIFEINIVILRDGIKKIQ
jgi:hypothetical protein